ncbi:hypothetical protein C5D98_14955 [Rathayibacter rathayi]|uniref:hypothetical protein n=1 Tax=Rathayibacter rathayi TaxID=33887 RepID=UPI000CE83554|nr:hypothetical protein [Rathayibacter rathayi]PPG77480.1 hypothetical protein C5C15_09300 [Rathayibacter rathayi]PPG94316.1 hypothetical protein C5C22_09035 [Rathayibacter rathayi]PPI65248.1 hypothetical protein C5D98_14955 [Rathayibacter rathayi]
MLDGWTDQEKDILAIVGILLGFSAGGAFSLAVFGAAIQRWLLDVGVFLRGTDLPFLFPWATDVGLDFPRLLIAIGIGLVVVIGLVAVIIGVRRRDNSLRG